MTASSTERFVQPAIQSNSSRRKNSFPDLFKVSYHPHGHPLEEVPSGKYLRVTISEDLSWREHINATSAKAIRSVGFLSRNLRNCLESTRSQAYTTLLRPVLEYASVVWDPYQQLISQLENGQAAYTGDYRSRDPGSISSMLHQLGWEPLEHRRARNRIIMLYKIYYTTL
ncbi:uncharacterized protein [Magallana gigas]|uniref:uncharacterized protein n=1 Tax=Magallana gigas TaxID=29159 RepID=UPI00333F7A36